MNELYLDIGSRLDNLTIFFKVTKEFFQTRDFFNVFYPTDLSYVQMTKKYDLSQKGFSFPMMCEIENS